MSQSEWSSGWREDTEYVPIDIDDVVHVTVKAMLVRQDDVETWIPLSCVEPGSEDVEGPCALNVAEWFAEKEGLV